MDRLVSSFESRGLKMHELEITEGEIEALGVPLDATRRHTRLSSKRFWRLRQGIRGLLRRRRVSGQAVEIMVGHCTFVGLIRRESLSCFSAVYSSIQSSYYTTTELWASVRSELWGEPTECFLGLMVTLVASWELQWNGIACATDACEEGFGVCLRALGSERAAQYGCVRERERFCHPGHVRARDAALLGGCEDLFFL